MDAFKKAVIIVSGGTGTRMQLDIPKQYLQVLGKPVIVHSIEKFLDYDPDMSLILVLGKDHTQYWNPIRERYFSEQAFLIAEGGNTRFDSVRNGLELVKETCVLGIHDAVRPMVSHETIHRCYTVALETGSAIPVVEIEDTIRSIETNDCLKPERSILRRVQTPQVFLSNNIKKAYKNAYEGRIYTDDAAVYEELFGTINLVEGNPENIKITRGIDLKIAKALLGD